MCYGIRVRSRVDDGAFQQSYWGVSQSYMGVTSISLSHKYSRILMGVSSSKKVEWSGIVHTMSSGVSLPAIQSW